MGSKCSSLHRNNNLRKIGEKTKTKSTQSLIKLTNTIIVPEYKKFPEEDYQKIKIYRGRDICTSIYSKKQINRINKSFKNFSKKK